MLNLWRLQLLKELAVLGTMSAVAEALNLTRPAVSQQLAQLEREVGVVLLERSGRSVRLTATARGLVERSNDLFALVESIEADLAAAKQSVSGDVRISAFSSFLATVMPHVVGALHEQYPKLRLILNELEPAEALRAVAAKQTDVAVVDDLERTGPIAESVEFHPLMTDHFYAVLPPQHRLAGQATIQLADLARDRWAVNTSAHTYHAFVVNACLAAGFRPTVTSDSRNTSATLALVRTGWAVSLLPGLALHYAPDDVHIRPLRHPLSRQIFAAHSRGSARRPAVAATLTYLERFSAEVQDLLPVSG